MGVPQLPQLAHIITSGLAEKVAAADPATVARSIDVAKELLALGEPEDVPPRHLRHCAQSRMAGSSSLRSPTSKGLRRCTSCSAGPRATSRTSEMSSSKSLPLEHIGDVVFDTRTFVSADLPAAIADRLLGFQRYAQDRRRRSRDGAPRGHVRVVQAVVPERQWSRRRVPENDRWKTRQDGNTRWADR